MLTVLQLFFKNFLQIGNIRIMTEYTNPLNVEQIELQLNDNRLESIPQLTGLSKLQKLSLNRNNINSLTYSFRKLINLKTLSVSTYFFVHIINNNIKFIVNMIVYFLNLISSIYSFISYILNITYCF